MWYRFSESEVEALLSLALSHLVTTAADYDSNRAKDKWHIDRADFLTAARIVAELHSPSDDPIAPPLAPSGLDPQMIEAARAEGIDLERELGGRVSDPRCIHGVSFTEHCAVCASPKSGPKPFNVSPEERAALEAAIEERRAAGIPVLPLEVHDDGKGLPDEPGAGDVELVADLERVPTRTVMHRAECPAAFEGERRPDLAYPCLCDFGQRLAAELGVPYSIVQHGA